MLGRQRDMCSKIWRGTQEVKGVVCKTTIHRFESGPRLLKFFSQLTKGKWWNGIHDGLKIHWPQGRKGSTPFLPSKIGDRWFRPSGEIEWAHSSVG